MEDTGNVLTAEERKRFAMVLRSVYGPDVEETHDFEYTRKLLELTDAANGEDTDAAFDAFDRIERLIGTAPEKRMTQDELAAVLEKHRLWLAGGPGGERADLSDRNLRKARLGGADLSGAVLDGADLRDAFMGDTVLRGASLKAADLRNADLRDANLRECTLEQADMRGVILWDADMRAAVLNGTDMRRAKMHGADLGKASLIDADLRGAGLYGAKCMHTDFSHADLRWTTLEKTVMRGADLTYADLEGARLTGTDLRGANLFRTGLYDVTAEKADLRGACIRGVRTHGRFWDTAAFFDAETLDSEYPCACPDTGAFTGWKKCRGNRIVRLEICEDAGRTSGTDRMCRCDRAKVVSIESMDGKTRYGEAVSLRDPEFVYRAGETVYAPDYDGDRFAENAGGIRFSSPDARRRLTDPERGRPEQCTGNGTLSRVSSERER